MDSKFHNMVDLKNYKDIEGDFWPVRYVCSLDNGQSILSTNKIKIFKIITLGFFCHFMFSKFGKLNIKNFHIV